MTTRVRILWLLVLGALLGGGNVCAQDGLGQIIYDDQATATASAGGLLEFYNNAACVDDYDAGKHQFSANENVPAEWLDAERTVYIKATPNPGHTLGTADAETHAVTFITATETVAMSGGNGARTRADGDAIAVTLVKTDGQAGIYKFQMPADGSSVTVTAAFPEHTVAKLGDTGYEHITFIDYETDAQTGTLTAVSRSTEDLKDANNQPVPVYVLDGTETTLGTAGTSESPTEAWYVCLTPATANNGKGLVYDKDTDNDAVALRLANYCHVHLILADGSLMNVGGESSVRGIVGSNFTIYGQGGTDGAGQSAEGVLNVSSLYEAMIIRGDLTINGGQVNAASPNTRTIDVEGGDIAIHGGIVKASSDKAIAIYAEDGDIAITGGSVICTAGYIECSYNGSGGHLTISGGEVNVSSAKSGIQCFKSFSISDGQVEAYVISSVEDLTISGGVVKLISDGYGIISEAGNVVISGGQVEASTINAKKDITLGWTAASDYIKAGSFTATSGVVKTKAGCRFVALDESAGEGLPTAKAIVPANATAGGGFALSDIAGQTLRPVDGYLLGLCPGLGVDLSNSPKSALEFTMAGDETTHYYIYKKDDHLLLSVGGVEDGFNGTVYKAGTPVELLQENQTDPTALPTACSDFDENTHTMNMPGKDLKIVAYRAYRTDVDYLIAVADELIQANVDELNFADKKAYILDGHDHMLYGFYDDEDYNQVGSSGFYVLEAKAKDTSGWMKDSEGNWMLTTNGNMFECRGSVVIILTDGSALCVGTETNPFPGSAVIYGDYDLHFFTQSEPGIPLDENGNLMAYTDNRGRMEIYSSGAKAIHAERDITLTNVVLSGGKSPLEFKLSAKGNISINGGELDNFSVESNNVLSFNPIGSTDEFHATSLSSASGMIEIAAGKALADREYPTTALSGAVPASEAAGKKLTELKTISGATGQYLPPSGAAAAAAAAAAAVTATANMVMVGNTGGAQKLVATSGSAVKSCYVTDITASGELEFAPNSAVVNGQPVDCSDLLLGSVVNKNADGTGNSKRYFPTVLTTEGQLSGSSPGETLPATIGFIGSGAANDVQIRGAAAVENVAENGLQTLVAGNGKLKEGELAKKGIHDENEKQSGGGDYISIGHGEAATGGDNSISIGHGKEDSGIQSLAIGYGHKVTGDHSGAYGDARKRAPKEDRLVMTLIPVDYDPDKVLPEGEIRLFVTNNQLLSIAIYQREHPDEVKKARARGALMIDTTTPETTAIIGRLMVTERAQPGDGHWYGLDGHRLPSAPTAKGVYVHRGRKVVIR